jgi:hypothetical protein
LILVHKGESKKTPLRKEHKQVWEWIDKSLPILIENKLTRLQLEEPEVWFVRIGMHKVKGKCIDIRQFVKRENEDTVWYEPTENGIVICIEGWGRVIDVLFKLFRKHKEK